ncbi:hypothetical protein ACFCP7_27000 [Paenibacillus elgii]
MKLLLTVLPVPPARGFVWLRDPLAISASSVFRIQISALGRRLALWRAASPSTADAGGLYCPKDHRSNSLKNKPPSLSQNGKGCSVSAVAKHQPYKACRKRLSR